MQLLDKVDADEVSPVSRPAIGRRFLLAKSAGLELDPELADVLAIPYEREGALVDALRKAGADETAQKAAVAVVRLLKGFDGELPADLVEKAMSQGDEPEELTEPNDEADEEVLKAYEELVAKRDYSAEQRSEMAGNGEAMEGGRYPIKDREDLQNAIHAIGRGKGSHEAIRRHIVARARALDATSLLPDDWQVSKTADDLGADTAEGERMSDTAAPAVPIQKSDGSWDLSGVPEESRGFYEAVLKAADTAKAENATLKVRVEKAETAAAEANAALREREFVAKADQEFGKIAPADELGKVLKAASEGLDEDTFGKLEAILKGANERVEKGELFSEGGVAVKKTAGVTLVDGRTTDAWGKIEELAKGLVEKADGGLSQEQAVDRVLKTAEGRALYADYMAETYSGAVS